MQPRRRDALALAAAALASPAAASEPPAKGGEGPSGPWTGGGELPIIGGRLRYVTLGPEGGEPLVLLHKVGGWVADWRHVAPALARNHRVIAFDLPGHGRSIMDGPPPPVVTVPEVAATLMAALDEIGVERFKLVGNSAGGLAGIVAAAGWPDRVAKLAVISVSLIPAMTRAAYAEQARNAALRPPTPAEQAAIFATVDPRVEAEQKAAGMVARPWMGPLQLGVARAGITDYLPRIKAPTLLINADRGRYLKYEAVGLKLIPNARAVVIPRSGAFTHQDNPADTAAALNAFLDAG